MGGGSKLVQQAVERSEATERNFKRMWMDQQVFNMRYRQEPRSWEERCAVTKELALCLYGEVGELLRAVNWKPHRKMPVVENLPRIRHELVDIFKYWMSLAQAWGMTPESLYRAYHDVSRVCDRRYVEEFGPPIAGECVVVDLDGVLCDYAPGIVAWMIHHANVNPPSTLIEQFHRGERPYVNAATMGVSEKEWQFLKHRFRTEGGKRLLPVTPFAYEFCRWVKFELKKSIVLLTSRPVGEYPNIRDDTVYWLEANGLIHDRLWFTANKHEELLARGMEGRVAWCVDDDPTFARQYRRLGLPVYLIGKWNAAVHGTIVSGIMQVENLGEVIEHEAGELESQTKR